MNTTILDQITAPVMTQRTKLLLDCAHAISQNRSQDRPGHDYYDREALRCVAAVIFWVMPGAPTLAKKSISSWRYDLIEILGYIHTGLLK